MESNLVLVYIPCLTFLETENRLACMCHLMHCVNLCLQLYLHTILAVSIFIKITTLLPNDLHLGIAIWAHDLVAFSSIADMP